MDLSVAGHLGYIVLPLLVAAESAGAPLPGETSLIAAAVLAANGHMEIGLVVGLAAIGAIVGDNVGYVLGRRLGRAALVARGPARRQRLRALRAAGALFDRYGGAAVFAGRFVAVGRVAVAWLAGADRFPWRRFAMWNAAGSVAWAVTVGAVAYPVSSAGAHWIAIAGLVVAVLAVAHLWRSSRSARPDADTAVDGT